jgi:alanine racemase
MDARNTLGESRLLISRRALLHNIAVIRRAIGPHTGLCAIIKADAYGHGASVIAAALCGRDGAGAADAVAVADLDEAARLPALQAQVIVLRPVENVYIGRHRSRLETAIAQGWTLTVCTASAAGDLARIAQAAGKRASVQVMIDTGMTRDGIDAAAATELVGQVQSMAALRLVALGTHLARAEEIDHPFNFEQLRRFREITDPLVAGLPPGRIKRHAANSAALFTIPDSHFDMVRPGISLYGIDPSGQPRLHRPLRPVMEWTAPLIGIRDVAAGTSVGYGQTWCAPEPTRVGLVPVGYADGYLRCFSNRGIMMVHGRPAPVLGRVSMDMTCIDLTGIATVAIGDEVTVLDADPLSVASVYGLARWADTIPYEIVSRIGPRVRRVAVDPAEEEPPITGRLASAG